MIFPRELLFCACNFFFFYRTIPATVSKEYLIQEMRLLTELLVPGVFGYDVQTNLSNLQDILDSNNLSILDVMSLVRINKKKKKILSQCSNNHNHILLAKVSIIVARQ